MKINTDSKKIKEILEDRSLIEKIYPSKESLEKILRSGKKLTIYHGVDPTAPSLHLGHSTNYFLLRKLQKLGHKIILLIGDFTAQIGDPTGKDKKRKSLTKKEILKNCKNYRKQVGKILDFNAKNNPALLEFNSKWLEKMALEDVIKLASKFTVQRMIERDMFQKRMKEGKPIWIHEFFYPLLQGYDSVEMDVEIEIGGNDQTFNMLVGRELMKSYKNKEKFVVTTPLLINKKTNKKLMSKSEGSFIALDDSPDEMYGKVMALPDEVIFPCFELCTEVSLREIKKNKKSLKDKTLNPRNAKAKLAREIVSIYHSKEKAIKAEKEFEQVFKKRKLPSSIRKVLVKEKNLNVLNLLVKIKLASSRSDAKRLILQRGVKINSQVQKDWKESIEIKKGTVIQVGKRKFIRVS